MQTIGVKECPAPTTFTATPSVAACSTMRTISASERGRSMAMGEHDWLRAQFDHRGRSGVGGRVDVVPEGAVTPRS